MTAAAAKARPALMAMMAPCERLPCDHAQKRWPHTSRTDGLVRHAIDLDCGSAALDDDGRVEVVAYGSAPWIVEVTPPLNGGFLDPTDAHAFGTAICRAAIEAATLNAGTH